VHDNNLLPDLPSLPPHMIRWTLKTNNPNPNQHPSPVTFLTAERARDPTASCSSITIGTSGASRCRGRALSEGRGGCDIQIFRNQPNPCPSPETPPHRPNESLSSRKKGGAVPPCAVSRLLATREGPRGRERREAVNAQGSCVREVVVHPETATVQETVSWCFPRVCKAMGYPQGAPGGHGHHSHTANAKLAWSDELVVPHKILFLDTKQAAGSKSPVDSAILLHT